MKVLPSAGEGLVTTTVCSGWQGLQVIQARAQRAEFFRRGFMGVVEIQQVRFGRGLERHDGDFRQRACLRLVRTG